MAITVLATTSNRLGPDSTLRGDVTTVALDATLSEQFRLPTGYGSLYIKHLGLFISALSGAYAAPTPAYDGVLSYIVSADSATLSDLIGTMRFVNAGTASARPVLACSFDLNNPTLLRMGELIQLAGPIIAGAGVTGTVTCFVRGTRFQTE